MQNGIVVFAGIKRSFSTGQYNLVRIALKQAGYRVRVFGHGYDPSKHNIAGGTVHLVKRHKFSKEIALSADHIFLTDRSDEGIIGSLTRFNGTPPYPGRIEDMRKHLQKWEAYSDMNHYFHYDLWMKDKRAYTAKIIKALGVNVGHQDVLEEFEKISPPDKGQDKETLLFANHITSEDNG